MARTPKSNQLINSDLIKKFLKPESNCTNQNWLVHIHFSPKIKLTQPDYTPTKKHAEVHLLFIPVQFFHSKFISHVKCVEAKIKIKIKKEKLDHIIIKS